MAAKRPSGQRVARASVYALRRDSVVGIYYPPLEIRELRELCRGRHTLVQLRTRLLQRLRALLLRHGRRRSPSSRVTPRCRTRRFSCCRRGRPPRSRVSRRMLAGVRAEIMTIDARRAAARAAGPDCDPSAADSWRGPRSRVADSCGDWRGATISDAGRIWPATRGWCHAWRRVPAGIGTAALHDADRLEDQRSCITQQPAQHRAQ